MTESSGYETWRERAAITEIGGENPIALTGPISRSTCAWMAAVTRGSRWPSAVTRPMAKSVRLAVGVGLAVPRRGSNRG
jgi:hypothetical protein